MNYYSHLVLRDEVRALCGWDTLQDREGHYWKAYKDDYLDEEWLDLVVTTYPWCPKCKNRLALVHLGEIKL